MVNYVLAIIACLCSLYAISLLALKNNKKAPISFPFSIIGIITGILALAISAPRDVRLLNVDYIGIIVTILAGITTLLLGFQLYHALNLKEDAKKVADAKDIIEKYANRVDKLEEKIKILEEKSISLDDLVVENGPNE